MCPDDNVLAAMIEGFLEPDRQLELEAHLDGCPACMEHVVGLARLLRTPSEPPDGLPRIGRFEVLRQLGSGAQGVVYAAFDPDLQRQVAVKIVRPDRAADTPEERRRVQREARLLAALSHPHVLPVYEIGPHPGGVFLATELLRGGTLRGRTVGRGGAPPWRSWQEVVSVWLGAGRGLAAAHRAGIVHRDVKPENFLLHDDGRAVLTDFGLATTSPGAAPSGTPSYLAPEVLAGAPADARSDQFAFCVGLHEALHGVRPYDGAPHDHAGAPARVPRVPRRVDRVVARGLALDPRDRFARMDDLLAALDAAARPLRWPAVAAVAALSLAVAGSLVLLGSREVHPAAPPPAAGPVARPGSAACDALAAAVTPEVAACEAEGTCGTHHLGRVLQVAQCTQSVGDCDGFGRWLDLLVRVWPDSPIEEHRAASFECPPADPSGRARALLRFGPNEALRNPAAAREVGARARNLLAEPGLPDERREDLWLVQNHVVSALRDHFGEGAADEAALAEAAFGRPFD